jgi:hypothetical protein
MEDYQMPKKISECKMENDGRDLFINLDGVRIARRGYPGTSYAGQWVSLEPGYAVRDNADLSEIEIEFKGVRLQ